MRLRIRMIWKHHARKQSYWTGARVGKAGGDNWSDAINLWGRSETILSIGTTDSARFGIWELKKLAQPPEKYETGICLDVSSVLITVI